MVGEIVIKALGLTKRYAATVAVDHVDLEVRAGEIVGILGPNAVDDMLLLRLKEEIGAIPTLRRIDIVDLNRTDEGFRRDVLSYAKAL